MKKLPKAVDFLGVSSQGQQLPMRVAARAPDGALGSWLVKVAMTRTQLGPAELVREAIGTTFASKLGLCCAFWSGIELPIGIRTVISERLSTEVTCKTAFGASFQANLRPFISEESLRQVPPEEIAKIVALDLVLANGDRPKENPNMAWLGERLFLFDYEQTLPLSSQPTEEECQRLISPGFLTTGETHALRDWVKMGLLERAIGEVCSLCHREELDDLQAQIPVEWSQEFPRFRAYLQFCRTRESVIVDNLRRGWA